MVEESKVQIIMIETIKHITKITNKSNLDVVISIKPVKPKRKYIDILLVKKGEFLIDENEIDLSQISISFTNEYSAYVPNNSKGEK